MSIITVAPEVACRFGEVCFIRRRFVGGDSLPLAVVLVGPFDLKRRQLRSECQKMYKSVS